MTNLPGGDTGREGMVSVAIDSCAVRASADGPDVRIEDANGSVEIRSGGTRAWRNNNPGNMRNSPEVVSLGAIGSAGGFAVFPDEATGTSAARSLLQTALYASLTVNAAVAVWAPPQENDTARYQSLVRQWTGLSGDESVATLTAAQCDAVIGAIKRMEGWHAGIVKRTTSAARLNGLADADPSQATE